MLKHWIPVGLGVACACLAIAGGSAAGQVGGAEAPLSGAVAVSEKGKKQGNTGVADGEESEASRARQVVQDELEQLRGEIAMLKVLREAQDALFAWNSLRVKSGERPTGLDRALCEKVRTWCEVLPASFGRMAGKGAE